MYGLCCLLVLKVVSSFCHHICSFLQSEYSSRASKVPTLQILMEIDFLNTNIYQVLLLKLSTITIYGSDILMSPQLSMKQLRVLIPHPMLPGVVTMLHATWAGAPPIRRIPVQPINEPGQKMCSDEIERDYVRTIMA